MRPSIVKAVLASFSVYLMPIIGPHAALPLGAALAMGWFLGEKQSLWIAAEVTLALALQGAALGLGLWFFRKPGAAKLAACLAALAFVWGVAEWSYLLAIPGAFLVDSTRHPEVGDWPEECRVNGYSLADVKTPPDLSLERAGKALVVSSATQELAILEMPGCGVTPLGVKWSNADPRTHSMAASGAVLVSQGGTKWRVFRERGVAPDEIAMPEGAQHPDPILSADGEWVAWLVRPPAVFLTPVSNGQSRSIDLQAFLPGSFRLDSLDTQAQVIILARNETEFLTLGLDGAEKAPPWKPPGVKAWTGTVRRMGDGWAAWDAYQEDEPYRLQWSLPAGGGLHTAQHGYRIDSAALAPSGRFLTVSVSGRYNFDMPDSVYVLRVRDGEEVFRRHSPRFTRGRAAFLGAETFAYPEGDSVLALRLRPTD